MDMVAVGARKSYKQRLQMLTREMQIVRSGEGLRDPGGKGRGKEEQIVEF